MPRKPAAPPKAKAKPKKAPAKTTKSKSASAPTTAFETTALRATIASVGGQGISVGDRDRLRVFSALDNKRTALFDAESLLRKRLRGANSTDRGLLLHAITQSILELDRVEARIAAIFASEPFSALPTAQETALLDAIRTVGRNADGSAATIILVESVLNLINTYKAKDTDPS